MSTENKINSNINLIKVINTLGVCIYCIKGTCKNKFHNEKTMLQERCSIFQKYLKNPLQIEDTKFKILEQIKLKLKNKCNNMGFFITTCNSVFINRKCNNISNGFHFKIKIGNNDYDVCYKDPKKCTNKILVCLHCNFLLSNKKVSICKIWNKIEEENEIREKELKVTNLNFPSFIEHKDDDNNKIRLNIIKKKKEIYKKSIDNQKKKENKEENDLENNEENEIENIKKKIEYLEEFNKFLITELWLSKIPIIKNKEKEVFLSYEDKLDIMKEKMEEDKEKAKLFTIWQENNVIHKL